MSSLMRRLQCSKCGKPVYSPCDCVDVKSYVPVECSVCERYFHAVCTDISDANVWLNLGPYKVFWKCGDCKLLSPSQEDETLSKKIKDLQVDELLMSVRNIFETLSPK